MGTYEYDPYGKLLSVIPNEAYNDTDNILIKNPFRYRGYYYDNETGWYYLQSRYYDPIVRRFINADTPDLLTNDCDNLMQYNLFMYCNGDPMNGIDPSGHFAMESMLALSLLLVAVVLTIALTINYANSDNRNAFFDSARTSISELKEAINPHDQFVYTLLDDDGNVAYVGRTKYLDKREAAHGRNPAHESLRMDYDNVIPGLTKIEARGLEQVIMIQEHSKSKGVPTANQINGVAHNNPNAMIYFNAAYNYIKNNPGRRMISNAVWDEIYNWKESNW